MAKALIYTALFGDLDRGLKEPLQEIPDCVFLCFTDKKDLKSDTWKIIHEDAIPDFFTFGLPPEQFRYKDPRMKARLIKAILPIRIRHFKIIDFFDKYENQIYIWIDGSIQLKQNPLPLIEGKMKDADILAFQHPDRQQLEDEALAAHVWRGTNLEEALFQVATYRALGFTREEQKALTATGFFFRRHSPQMDFFNLSWIKEILLHTDRDQLSVDYCIWKHKLKRNFIMGTYRRSPWIQYFPHPIVKPT